MSSDTIASEYFYLKFCFLAWVPPLGSRHQSLFALQLSNRYLWLKMLQMYPLPSHLYIHPRKQQLCLPVAGVKSLRPSWLFSSSCPFIKSIKLHPAQDYSSPLRRDQPSLIHPYFHWIPATASRLGFLLLLLPLYFILCTVGRVIFPNLKSNHVTTFPGLKYLKENIFVPTRMKYRISWMAFQGLDNQVFTCFLLLAYFALKPSNPRAFAHSNVVA